MQNAVVLLADGFEEIEALSVVDILRRGGVEVVMAAIGENVEVRGAHGIIVKADETLANVKETDFAVVILPGGGEGTENLKASHEVFDLLRRQKSEGRLIAAICAAPIVLVEAEVLDPDQHITCYPTCSVELDRKSANVPVVADGDIITGQGPGAAMLFALVILQALLGEKTMHKIARQLVTNVLD
ncbi:MAG: DJ-1/PfpI family protein [Kiritimatiellae bacterium]|nr:DJ-1/PfpI family protein [Kiritimatiellia bacterium]